MLSQNLFNNIVGSRVGSGVETIKEVLKSKVFKAKVVLMSIP